MSFFTSIMNTFSTNVLNLPSSLSRSILCFLVNRTLQEYLNKRINSEDLEVNLGGGTASIKQLELNVSYINEAITHYGFVSVCEGTIGELSVSLPNVSSFLSEGIEISINDLLITLNPLREINDSNARELVENVTKTLARRISIDANATAEECCSESGQNDNEAVKQLADIVDQLMTQVKFVFKNVVMRIESDRNTSNGPQVAIEIRIEQMEFVDDHVKGSEKRNGDGELQKLLNINDVSLYTDIFSPMSASSFSTSTISNSSNEEKIATTPVQFARFNGKHSVKISVENNSAPGVDGILSKKTHVEFDSKGSLFFMLTPSQITLLTTVLSQISPKPKEPVSRDPSPIQKPIDSLYTSMATSSHQPSWEPPPRQSMLSSMISSALPEDLSQISLDDRPVRQNISSAPPRDLSPINLTEASVRPVNRNVPPDATFNNGDSRDDLGELSMSELFDVISLTINVANIYGIITHEDPLCRTNVEKAMNEGTSDAIQSIVEMMAADADIFFTIIPSLESAKKHEIHRQKQVFDKAFSGDHLQFTIQSAMINHKFETDGLVNRIELFSSFKRVQISESLTKDSLFGADCGDTLTLLSLNDESGLKLLFESKWKSGFARDHAIHISVPALKVVIDPSIIDRLSNLIVPTPYFQFSENGQSTSNVELECDASKLSACLSCPNLEVFLFIPVAGNPELSHTICNVHQEYFKFNFADIFLTLPPSDICNLSTFGKLDVRCSSIIGTFVTSEKDTNQPFLFASLSSEVPFVSVNYDFRNKSIINCNTKESSIFTKKNAFLDGVKLIMPGTPNEASTFSRTSQSNSDINVDVDLASVNLHFYDKAFFEMIYKRICHDLCLFKLKAPPFLNPEGLNETIAASLSDEDNEDTTQIHFNDSDSDSEVIQATRKSHKVSLNVSSNSVKILIGASGGESDKYVKSQIGLNLEEMKLILVSGYHGQAGVIHCHVGAVKNTVVHRNLISYVAPFQSDVCKNNFMAYQPTDVITENYQNDDNTDRRHACAFAVKVIPSFNHIATKEQKSVTYAVVVQDTVVHFRPFTDLSGFWLTQLINFFDINYENELVPDEVLFVIKPNIHISNISIGYDHKLAVPGSLMNMRINIGSCDLFTLDPPKFYFQDTMLSMRKAVSQNATFVNILNLQMLILKVNTAKNATDNDKQTVFSTKLSTEVLIRDAAIKAWLCSDTVSEFMNVINDLSSNFGNAFGNSEANGKIQSPALLQAVPSAVNPVEWAQDEFVQIHSFEEETEPQEDVQAFEPKILFLDDDLTAQPSYLTIPTTNGNSESVDLPDNHSKPIFKLRIENASLEAYLYGGNDFGTELEPKLFSKSTDSTQNNAGYREGSVSGPFRDHTVCVGIKATKVNFNYETFDDANEVSTLQILTVNNIELIDHLLISNATNLLIKHPEGLQYCFPKPALLLRKVTNQKNQGKLHVRMEPLKMNIDQDTMDFLSDFIANFCAGLADGNGNEESVNAVPTNVTTSAETLYTEFKFFPSCKINFDYTGKRIDLQHQQGIVPGLASGILQLTGTELTLKELSNTDGLLGISKCIEFAMNEWSSDVITQLPSNVVTLAPFAPITSVVSTIMYYPTNYVYPSVSRLLWAPWLYFQQSDNQ